MSGELENVNFELENKSFEDINQSIIQANSENWKNYVNEKSYAEFLVEQEKKFQLQVDLELEKRQEEIDKRNEIIREDNAKIKLANKIIELTKGAEFWFNKAGYTKKYDDLWCQYDNLLYAYEDELKRKLTQEESENFKAEHKKEFEAQEKYRNELRKKYGNSKEYKELIADVNEDKRLSKEDVNYIRRFEDDISEEELVVIKNILFDAYRADYAQKKQEELKGTPDEGIDILNSVTIYNPKIRELTEELDRNSEKREEVEQDLLPMKKQTFVTYGDYVSEYKKQNFDKNIEYTNEVLNRLTNQDSYRLDDNTIENKDKISKYQEKCREIERWKNLIIEKYPTKEMLTKSELDELEKSQETFSREYCIEKCKSVIMEMMDDMEKTMAKTLDGARIEIGKGDNKNNLEKIKEIYIELDRTDEIPYQNLEEMLTAINRLGDAAQSSYDGELEIPKRDVKELNGKKCHFIDATKMKSEYVKGMYKRGPNGIEIDKEEKVMNYDEIDKSNEPLFSHEPCKEDITQGNLGDCFMVASLSAIAAQDPQKIKDMLKDNNDGTVTVRLFNNDKEPVFITVTKTVPKDPEKNEAIYARKILWVQMIEKAFAASGVVADDLMNDISLDNNSKRTIKYHNINNGGYSFQFIPRILGTDPGVFFGDHQKLTIEKIKFEKKGPYTEAEMKIVNFIEEALRDEKILTTSAKEKFKIDRSKIDGLEHLGIYEKHAYTLIGLDKDEDGTIYVKVRNPHNSNGVVQDKGKNGIFLQNDTKGGIIRLELRVFGKYYDYIHSNNYDLTPTRRDKLVEANEMIRRYGSTINDIQKSLEDSDNIFMVGLNSKEFKKFKEAANNVKQAMEAECPSPESIDKAMKSLFEQAAEYENHCINSKNIDITKATNRAVQRYKASVITSGLMDIYIKNEPKDRTYESFIESEKREKLECSYRKLAEEANIPTTGWEQISSADKSITQKIKEMKDANKRAEFYEKVGNFLDKKGDLAFRSDRIKGLNEGKKNNYFKEKRDDLEMMIAISKYGNSIAELMEADGYQNGHVDLVNELKTKQNLFNAVLDKTKAVTDPRNYAHEKNLLGRGEGVFKEHINDVNKKAKDAEKMIDRLDLQKNNKKVPENKEINIGAQVVGNPSI